MLVNCSESIIRAFIIFRELSSNLNKHFGMKVRTIWFDFSCLSGPKALSEKLFRPEISQNAKSN